MCPIVYWTTFSKVMAGIAFVNCTYNETLHRMFPIMHPRCPEQSWLAGLLMALYLVLVNVLLLNLLIAMLRFVWITHRKVIDSQKLHEILLYVCLYYSHTIEEGRNRSELGWKSHFYHLVLEYYEKPTLVQPLSIFYDLYVFLRYIIHKIYGVLKKDYSRDTPFCEYNNLHILLHRISLNY